MYSEDLRKKVITSYETGTYSYRGLVSKFDVSLNFVSSVVTNFKETGNIKSLKIRKTRDRKLTGKNTDILLDLIKSNPSITLNEIVDIFNDRYNFQIGKSSIDRKLKSLKITYKKKHLSLEKGYIRVQENT